MEQGGNEAGLAEKKEDLKATRLAEKRKKTLNLKGIDKPNFSKVIEILERYLLVKRSEVERVFIHKVQDSEWAFVTLPSEEAVEATVRKSYKLKGTNFYVQKDLSKEVRLKLKEERLAKLRESQNKIQSGFIHPQRHPLHQPQSGSGVVSTVLTASQHAQQDPNVRPVGVQPRNFNITTGQQMPYLNMGLLYPNQQVPVFNRVQLQP